jgi:predicted CXXCH cytochrome family protein
MRTRNGSLPWIAALIGILLFLTSPAALAENKPGWGISGFTKYVTIPGAARVGSEACTNCHSNLSHSYRHALHSQQGVVCEDCHGAGSLHNQAGDVTKIVSYRRASARDANGACLSCHAQDEKTRNWMSNTHASNGVRCTDCHQVHNPEAGPNKTAQLNFDATNVGRPASVEGLVPESSARMQPRSQKNDACLKCHQAQVGEMSLPYHHPLREGKISCVDCHDPHGGSGRNNLRTANVNQLCLGCHAQYRGPFAYQHPPVMENCMSCHTAHGSPNTNLLSVSQPALCLQCHAAHHNGANLPLVDRCTNCHASIHGSDIASATGGSVFIDKGSAGLPGSSTAAATATASRAAKAGARSFPAASPHSSAAAPLSGGGLGGALGGPLAGQPPLLFPWNSGPTPDTEAEEADTYRVLSFSPRPYRLMHSNGYTGRVGEYDSLQQSTGGDVELAYVSVPRRMTLLSRADLITGDDYRFASQFNLGKFIEATFDLRSFFQQQDNYPSYSTAISPDIVTTNDITNGSVFAIKRRLGQASARIKVPKLPVHLFVKGNWQTRVGEGQLTYFDMGGDAGCGTCHSGSQFQSVHYTTRNVSGGAEIKLGRVNVTYEHGYSSFNNRVGFPTAAFGATLGVPDDPLPAGVSDTLTGTYFLVPPAPNQASTDTLRLNWTASPRLVVNSDVGYTRLRNIFTRNPQNALDANAAANWRPLDRLRFTADYHQYNVLNGFTPFYSLYGNMSYHQHSEGLRAEYDLTNRLDVEVRFTHSGITRSNSQLWPQFYSPDNTDLLYLMPSSSSKTTGLALRYHGGKYISARAGYDWTGTHNPGYLTVPQDNNRMFGDLTLTPAHWLSFTNDISVIVQNAFPVVQRRNRFYMETATASLTPVSYWNLQLGYAYQQNNLATYMALQNDPGAGYVLDAPLVPYKQLSQTYWAQSASKFFQQRLGFNARITYNSARSGMQPDLNPTRYPAIPGQDPVLFQQALDTFALAATQISQVIVPEYTAQARLNYLLGGKFDLGLLYYYGSYRDYLNSNLNGVLRTYSVYVTRSW